MYRLLVIVLIIVFIVQLSYSYQPYQDTDPDYAASVHHLKSLVILEAQLLPTISATLETEQTGSPAYFILESYLGDFYSSNVYPLKGKISLGQFISLLNYELIDVNILAANVAKHPLKSYRTIRRFVGFIAKFSEVVHNEALMEAVNNAKRLLQFPKEADLQAAMQNILRLRQIFKLTVTNLLEGQLEDLQTDSGLSMTQLVEIASHARSLKMFTHTIDFYDQVRITCGQNRMGGPKECSSFNFQEIEANLTEAIISHDKLHAEGIGKGGKSDDLSVAPPDSSPFVFNGLLESLTSEQFGNRTYLQVDKELSIFLSHPNYTSVEMNLAVSPFIYEKLCRGGTLKQASEMTSLKCYYLSTHPTYLIGPLKVEIHNENPQVAQIYDVVSPSEIRDLKTEVEQEMRQSRTASAEGDDVGLTSRYRTSANAWIEDNEVEKYKYLNNRISRITGLITTGYYSAELVQIAAYTPGGHYTPHSDAIFEEGIKERLPESEFERGDRIMTFMIYLSNVEKGGGTGFPTLKTAVQPIPGSAVVWHNLHSDGSINYDLIHGGCPVLYGTKWIANKWIRSNDQMFVKKCPSSRMNWNL